jgi:hypothetical protein
MELMLLKPGKLVVQVVVVRVEAIQTQMQVVRVHRVKDTQGVKGKNLIQTRSV